MSTGDDHLIEAIRRGPIFLFLGQAYLRLETGKDLFLSEVIRHFDLPGDTPAAYRDVLRTLGRGDSSVDQNDVLAFMQNLSGYLPAPSWLTTVAQVAWNGLYTSAIDTMWHKTFRHSRRELYRIFTAETYSADSRSISNLHCACLYGSLSSVDPERRPPLGRRDWVRKDPQAINLLSQLPDLLTEAGTLFIEGYDPRIDPLSSKNLAGLLVRLQPGQAHLFSVSKGILEDEDLLDLLEDRLLILHEESLASFIRRTIEYLPRIDNSEESTSGWALTVKTKTEGLRKLVIPVSTWNRITQVATVLDDQLLSTLRIKSSQAERRRSFAQFLANSAIQPVWSGYSYGFAFRRDFENRLQKTVEGYLDRNEIPEYPIILHGQSATGKTIALGSLAFKIRTEKNYKYPVLFIDRNHSPLIGRRTYETIANFCEWMEDQGAISTLIIWDGSQSDDDAYNQLHRALESRGRRFVLVGSCYRLREQDYEIAPSSIPRKKNSKKIAKRAQDKRKYFILAPAEFNNEINRFQRHLLSIDQNFALNMQSAKKSDSSERFLNELYWRLQETRGTIRKHVADEIKVAERTLQSIVNALKNNPDYNMGRDSNMAVAYNEAVDRLSEKRQMSDADNDKDINEDQIENQGLVEDLNHKSEIEESILHIVDLIMVPAAYGLGVPLDLLSRALSKEDLWNLRSVLLSVDILAFEPQGKPLIYARTKLEASIFIEETLKDNHMLISIVQKLLSRLQPKDIKNYNEDTLNFAVDLLQRIGPNSKEYNPRDITEYHPVLIDTLRSLRSSGVSHPRLILQESVLIRESVVRTMNGVLQQMSDEYDANIWYKAEENLIQAESILELTIKTLLKDAQSREKDKKPFSVPSILPVLYAEMVAILGRRLSYIIEAKKNDLIQEIQPSLVQELLSKIQDIAQKGLELNPNNFHLIDSYCHPMLNLLAYCKEYRKGALLTEDKGLEIEVNLLHLLSSIDTDEANDDIERKVERHRQALYEHLDQGAAAEQALQALEQQGSPVAYYLRVLKKFPDRRLPWKERISETEVNACEEALSYLNEHQEAVSGDSRLAALFFKLWWMSKTRSSWLLEERKALNFDVSIWQECRRHLETLVSLPSKLPIQTLKYQYLLGVATFHLALHKVTSFDEATRIFKKLSQEADEQWYSRRMHRYYLASKPDGTAWDFNGYVKWFDKDKKWGEAEVEMYQGLSIRFKGLDFFARTTEIHKNQDMPRFHIAFSFISPVAEPISGGSER